MDLWTRSYGGLLKTSPDLNHNKNNKNNPLLAAHKEMVNDVEVLENKDDDVECESLVNHLDYLLDDHTEDKQRQLKKMKLVRGSAGARTRRRLTGGGRQGVDMPPRCQVDQCAVDLSDARGYHQKHKVCEAHSKLPVAVVAGLSQRFCQQCSRFHELSEFDEAKRSCRRKLEIHNMRRRNSQKSSRETSEEGSPQLPERGRAQKALPGNPSRKNFGC